MAPGTHLGVWTLEARLGAGGNGEVWRASAEDDREAAIKVLSKVEPAAYRRFADEIHVVLTNKLSGIAPIIDHFLPADSKVDLGKLCTGEREARCG